MQRQAVSWFEISLRDGLTVAALQERSATTIVLLQAFDLRFHSETNRTERKAQFRRTETENTVWFDALAEEQLALIADGIFHGSSFHLVLRLNFLSINAACRGECGGRLCGRKKFPPSGTENTGERCGVVGCDKTTRPARSRGASAD